MRHQPGVAVYPPQRLYGGLSSFGAANLGGTALQARLALLAGIGLVPPSAANAGTLPVLQGLRS
jgi:hypothetical protein